MSREIVLVTGASSGIGLELAKVFAKDGSELILVARNEEKLQQLAEQMKSEHGTVSTVIAMDLSVADAAQDLFDQVQQLGKTVDVLINNAGFGQFGKFEEIPVKRHTSMCQLNMIALTELTSLFIKPMKERDSGTILNIASTAAFQPGPNCAVYYATKAFVLSLSEAIHAELWGTNVTVTCLCPGPTATGFGEDSDMEDLAFFKNNAMDVTVVAKAGHRGVRKKKRLVVPGIYNNILSFSNRFTARPVLLWVMKRIQPIE